MLMGRKKSKGILHDRKDYIYFPKQEKDRIFEHIHGPVRALRGVRWLVMDQTVSEPLIGSPVLTLLSHNTRDMLSGAAEKYYGFIDKTEIFGSFPEPKGKLSRILIRVYHADRGFDDSDIVKLWID